ncbi:hypothetical protein B7463_g10634, partial [Scytalidium lignicola]
MFGTHLVVTDDSENIKSIMSTRFADWGKCKIPKGIWNDVMGDSVFTADGHAWELQKDSSQPHLSKNRSTNLRVAEQHMRLLLSKIYEKGPRVGINMRTALVNTELPHGGGQDSTEPVLIPKETRASLTQIDGKTGKEISGRTFRSAMARVLVWGGRSLSARLHMCW